MGGMSSKYYEDYNKELQPMIISLTDVPGILANGCQEPGCTHDHGNELALHQRCHPGAGSRAWLQQDGCVAVVELKCCECEQHIAAFYVGDKP